MKDQPDTSLVLRLDLRDERLRERVSELLAAIPGLRIARPGDSADLTIREEAVREDPGEVTELTPRERQVLLILAEGASNREIARRLGISVHTAKFHVGSILDKLDATGRTDAVAHAARLGVIQL